MKKKSQITVLLIVMVALSIILSGCSGISGTGRKDPEYTPEYRTGSQGLVLNLVSYFDKLYERDQRVKMIVEVRNRGAFPQPDESTDFEAYIWTGGYDETIMTLTPEMGGSSRLDTDSLEGRSPINMEGGYTAFVFEADVYDLPSGTSIYRTPILIDVTYTYRTTASPIVCIDPDPTQTNIKDKVCEVSKYGNVNLKGSQGAPVAVTTVEEDITSQYLLFKIHVANVGGGRVIPKEMVHEDPNYMGFDYTDVNKVYIRSVTIGNTPLMCSPNVGEYLDVERGRGYILCKYYATGARVYKSPLNIELEYGYQTSIKKDIQVIQEVI